MRTRREALLRFAAFFVCAALLGTRATRAREWYVSKTGSNADGQSWATAYTSLQTGINAASGGDEVWVAAGTYTGQITMKDNVDIYGGFAGGEGSRDLRDWETNVTTLDAQGMSNTTTVIGASSARLDGFTVTGGNGGHGGGIRLETETGFIVANCSITGNTAALGAGIRAMYDAEIVVQGCDVSNNNAVNGTARRGGGISAWYSSLTMIDCLVTGNWAEIGGGLESVRSTIDISNCTFSSNTASVINGGMDLWRLDNATITNCTFAFNSGGDWGGGIHSASCSPTITNCTFYGNTAELGGAIHNQRAAPVITNCIMWGNTGTVAGDSIYDEPGAFAKVTYSCVEGGYEGTGNFDADPLFVDAPGGDLRLQPGSPCTDAADGDSAPGTDIAVNPRRNDPGVPDRGVGTPTYADIGACEFEGTSSGKWLDVLAPLPGVPLGVGQQLHVCWSSSSQTTQVGIELSRNGGTSWAPLAGPIPNNGVFSWTATQGAPVLPQTNCLIRVTDWSDPGTTGTSQPFTIFSGIWYVDTDAAAGGDGFTWSSAFQHPQDGADAARSGQEVWVAEGSYLRRSAGDTVLLVPGPGVAVYGGFAATPGTEGVRNARDWNAYPATFDGEGVCYHVAAIADAAILDGFTLTGGTTPTWNYEACGGGFTVMHASWARIANCRLVGNLADDYGGGGACLWSAPQIVNCEFAGNRARRGGAGFGALFSSPLLTNCTFTANVAGDGSGGVYARDNSAVTPVNCVFWGNTGPDAPEIYAEDAGSAFIVSSSCVGQAGYDGVSGNVNADPLFVDPGYWIDNVPIGDSSNDIWVDGDYHLQAGSPCIDAADGDAAPPVDMDGLLRYDDPAVEPNTGTGTPDYADMGAHELGGSATGTVTGTVLLRYSADPGEVTITAGGQTGTVTVVSKTIEYTIYNVPGTTTEVIVETTESSCTVTGSPAAIAWVGTTGTASPATVSPPPPFIPRPLANDGSGCTSGAGGRGNGAAGWALAAIAALAVLALRRARAADGIPG